MVWDYSAEIRPVLFESDPTLDGQRITLTIDGKSKVMRSALLSSFRSRM